MTTPVRTAYPPSCTFFRAPLPDGATNCDFVRPGRRQHDGSWHGMTLQDFLRVLRERWLIVAVLVAPVAAGATWFIRPAGYTAKLTRP